MDNMFATHRGYFVHTFILFCLAKKSLPSKGQADFKLKSGIKCWFYFNKIHIILFSFFNIYYDSSCERCQ